LAESNAVIDKSEVFVQEERIVPTVAAVEIVVWSLTDYGVSLPAHDKQESRPGDQLPESDKIFGQRAEIYHFSKQVRLCPNAGWPSVFHFRLPFYHRKRFLRNIGLTER
jgi:hypothetical protein